MPEHYFGEVAGALRRLEIIERKIDSATAAAALDGALQLPTRRVNVKPLIDEAWTLRFNITIADAVYVVVAKHLDARSSPATAASQQPPPYRSVFFTSPARDTTPQLLHDIHHNHGVSSADPAGAALDCWPAQPATWS